MCGIAGIINLDGRLVDVADLYAMNAAIVHRGPDGDGIFCQGAVGLTHRRLAIIDPQGGVQPMYSRDHRIVLVYNGEVYNYKEVRSALQPGHTFVTESDTEVILNAYLQWGIAALAQMRGMFAFALYDSREEVVYLVRDRMGIKPLYYYQSPTQICFASELQSLLQLATVPRAIDRDGLASYFRYQYVPTPVTIYQHIYKLEPGHYLKIDLKSGRVDNEPFWQLKIAFEQRTEEEWLEELNHLLDETIKIYIRSDVPFGAFLSGGVDSSLVTALMTRHLPEPVKTISIGFQEEQYSELPFAAEVSQRLQTNHYAKVVSSQLGMEILQQITVHFGEPFADSSAIPTYYVAQEAARHVKMVLSGDGGDELFGGYNSYQRTFRDFKNPPQPLPSGLLKLMQRYGYPAKVRRWAQRAGMNLQQKHDSQRQIFDNNELSHLLGGQSKLPSPVRGCFAIATDALDPVTCFQAQDAKTYMVDDVLTKVDRMSMAHSLEVRVPLLDHKVVELAFSLPLDLKLRFGESRKQVQTKYLLKQSTARFFAPAFLNRAKMGFGIPVVEWCQGPLRPLIEDVLRDRQNSLYGWLDDRYVNQLLERFWGGEKWLVAKVWAILMFELWLRTVHERTAGPKA